MQRVKDNVDYWKAATTRTVNRVRRKLRTSNRQQHCVVREQTYNTINYNNISYDDIGVPGHDPQRVTGFDTDADRHFMV